MRTLTILAEQALAPVPGGTGRYTGQLAGALADHSPDGWRLRVLTAWHRTVGAARVSGAAGPFRLPVGARTAATLWRHGLPPWPGGDSLHATTPLAPPPRPWARRPVVATVHDLVPWTDPETLTRHGAGWHRAMIARLARSADAIVVPTQVVADQLADRLPVADRVVVIPHGTTELPVPADAARRRAALGLGGDPYVLFVGTVEPRKGIDVLIAALSRPELAGLGLVVLGHQGWGGVDLPALARRHGLDGRRLHLLGPRGDPDLAATLDGAALLAMPSRSEGFGLPVLEAMAAGIPVVHSTAPALLEVAGGAGYPVPVGDVSGWTDALSRVAGDSKLAHALSRQGRRRAAEFTWRAAAERTWRVHVSLG